MMTHPDNVIPEIADSTTIRVMSPDGEIFVHCTENSKGQLKHVIINIGKSGLSLASWADALSRMINIVLRYEDVNTVIAELSNITTAKSVFYTGGTYVKSVPHAVYLALTLYKNSKLEKRKNADSRPLVFR